MARRFVVISRFCTTALAAALAVGATDCYPSDNGSAPPLKELYFPVGLQVSAGGNVLYAINSDFDLQYNGGTLQSYDLALIRRHVLDIIADPRAPNVPIVDRAAVSEKDCPARTNPLTPLGESCAPPVDSSVYVRDSAVVGAFATDLLLSKPPSLLVPARPKTAVNENLPFGGRRMDRLFAPIRGTASLAWATVERDSPDRSPPFDPKEPWGPFTIQCGQTDDTRRCGASHAVGSNPDLEPDNTRRVTMPGEPFGMAISDDGESLLVTHQNEPKTSLFKTGQTRDDGVEPKDEDAGPAPSLQFVLEGVPLGGIGLAAIPHDREAFDATQPFPRSAFLETSRVAPQLSLIRRYTDEFGGVTSTQSRPFLDLEGAFNVAIGAGGTDSRGIVVDPTPRLACKAKVPGVDEAKGRFESDVMRERRICARKPARVFIANRSPASLLVGEVGSSASAQDGYDPDRVVIHTSVPLSAGPSKLYLAPVVERDGTYGLRLFVVCFDSATVFVFDPETNALENVIRVGLGPFAMAFDPFTLEDVAQHAKVVEDTRQPEGRPLRRYRFAYLASFTNSFVQVIDLDNSQASATYERIVFTLGKPKAPKGT